MSHKTTIPFSTYYDVIQSQTRDNTGIDPFLFRELNNIVDFKIHKDGNIEIEFDTEESLLLFLLRWK